jgi:sugar transferase (PEP-CTERM system associated)
MLRLFKQYYPIRNALFVFVEGVLIFISVLTSIWFLLGKEAFQIEFILVFKAFIITLTSQTCLYYNDLYNLKITDKIPEVAIRLLQSFGAAAIILAFLYMVFPEYIITEGIFIVTIVIVIFLIVGWRIVYTQILNLGWFNQKIVLIGANDIAKEIYRQIVENKDCGYQIVSFVNKENWAPCSLSSDQKISCSNTYEDVCKIARETDIKKVIVALKEKRGALPVKELLQCKVNGIEVLDGNTFYEMLTGKLIVEQINPSWLIFSNGFQKTTTQKIIKRIVDLVLAISMLTFFSPILLLVAIIIKLDSKGPIIFSQERVGRKHKPYRVYKFRSMKIDAEKDTGPIWAQKDDQRITRFGTFIRKWRIDEIPQLVNVLLGDMSFVGPRPEREHFVNNLQEIIPYYRERFTVKPGLTGWAQVSYGYGASVEDAIEKLNYDLFYIKNMSLLMDLMIVARTVKTVLFGMGR